MATGLAILGFAATATGAPCVVADNGGTAELPPAGCLYESPADVFVISDGLPAGTTIEMAAIYKDFICGDGISMASCTAALPPATCEGAGGSLGGNVGCYSSVLELDISGTGTLAGFSRFITVPIFTEVNTEARTPGNSFQSFDTEMVQFTGQIFGDPDFCVFQFFAGSANALPSPGHTILTEFPGGNWNVDSFFDITYQIAFQGCPGSSLEGFAGISGGTIHMETGDTIEPAPTVNHVGLLLLAISLVAAAVLRLRRAEATG